MSCPDCITGSAIDGEPTGVFSEDIKGAYFAASPTGSSKVAIILLTDIFGLPYKNSRLLADKFAASVQCDVWVPDIFDGEPPFRLDDMKVHVRASDKPSVWGFYGAVLRRIGPLFRSRPSVLHRRISSFIEKLQAQKKYEKLGAIGYCIGGSVAVRLGGTDLINSVVICHPGGLSLGQIKAIKVPAAWVCAEVDFAFPEKQRKQSEVIFEARKGKEGFVEYEFKDYPGTAHGFAARPDLSYPEIKEAYEGACQQATDWFKKTLV
ncbi:dienelactone hydrolase endo-1,3,1,4-beta-D-glucanase [Mycena floridula]|nr:dienelactone hydrolase endo-1,3,1,4-beta-D-glucanase [Mycena floridula]